MLMRLVLLGTLLAWNDSIAWAEEVRFLGQSEISGMASDLSGETGSLEDGSPTNRLGGFGSGIAWLGGNRYVVIPDRGPGDGIASYRCRFHLIEVAINQSIKPVISVSMCETHLLTQRTGQPLIGLAAAIPSPGATQGLRFDPEAIRSSGRGSFYIADEYGPSILEFDACGRQIGEVPIPARYHVDVAAANPDDELPPANRKGRQPNKGMECLAISTDGETLFGLMQGALLQDGALDAEGKRVGRNLRLIELQRRTGAVREFVYQLEKADYGCSEIEFVAPGKLLVIERDGKPGLPDSTKHLYEVNLTDATDVSRVDSLPPTELHQAIHPVKKRLFLDLVAPCWGLAGQAFPAKIEGIALGPALNDGSRVLLVTSDNDFKPEEPSRIYAFAVK